MAPKKNPKPKLGTQKCGWKGCKSRVNVKNTSHTLPRGKCCMDECRAVRSHCACIKFCSAAHLSKCKAKPVSKPAWDAKGREAVSAEQFLTLYYTVLWEVGAVWACVLMLVQLFLRERADAARQCRFNWLVDLSEGSAVAGGLADRNAKTPARSVALDREFACIFHSWLHEKPLFGKQGRQWPFDNQPTEP